MCKKCNIYKQLSPWKMCKFLCMERWGVITNYPSINSFPVVNCRHFQVTGIILMYSVLCFDNAHQKYKMFEEPSGHFFKFSFNLIQFLFFFINFDLGVFYKAIIYQMVSPLILEHIFTCFPLYKYLKIMNYFFMFIFSFHPHLNVDLHTRYNVLLLIKLF